MFSRGVIDGAETEFFAKLRVILDLVRSPRVKTHLGAFPLDLHLSARRKRFYASGKALKFSGASSP